MRAGARSDFGSLTREVRKDLRPDLGCEDCVAAYLAAMRSPRIGRRRSPARTFSARKRPFPLQRAGRTGLEPVGEIRSRSPSFSPPFTTPTFLAPKWWRLAAPRPFALSTVKRCFPGLLPTRYRRPSGDSSMMGVFVNVSVVSSPAGLGMETSTLFSAIRGERRKVRHIRDASSDREGWTRRGGTVSGSSVHGRVSMV